MISRLKPVMNQLKDLLDYFKPQRIYEKNMKHFPSISFRYIEKPLDSITST